MLRRVNAATYEAPAGADIQVVVESQSNNGVEDARFEYDGAILPRQTINGSPGCSFTVVNQSAILQAIVAFDDGAPATARYDMSEVENGVLSGLGKSVRKSSSAPLISFAIDPLAGGALSIGKAKGARKRPKRAKKTAKKSTARTSKTKKTTRKKQTKKTKKRKAKTRKRSPRRGR